MIILMLPVELLQRIAAVDRDTYRAMLAVPPFARSLDPGTIADYMILFGYGVIVTSRVIMWTYRRAPHRVGGCALENVNGDKFWFILGERHREDGPAAEYSRGTKFWYRRGLLHREDGPAAIYANGGAEWYHNGKLHRENGPAAVGMGTDAWYLHGVRQSRPDAGVDT